MLREYEDQIEQLHRDKGLLARELNQKLQKLEEENDAKDEEHRIALEAVQAEFQRTSNVIRRCSTATALSA